MSIRNLCVLESMPDRDTIASALYTRQQVARLTGLDDSTLNYWMREGVLRPSEGGFGKGQHRRFPYHQINLALMLNELRGFGVSLPEIKKLAIRFHDAIDTFDRLGITREHDEPLSRILYLRKIIEQNGFFEESVREEDLPRYLEVFPWLDGRDFYRTHKYLAFKFKSTFEESIEIMRKGHLVYNRELEEDEQIPDSIVELAKTIDLSEYDAARRYWAPISYITVTSPSNYDSNSYDYLYRNENQEWEISAGDPPRSVTSHVGINLDLLTFNAWSKP